MGWCLSTGSTWIFGTIQLNDDGTYVMRMTELMKLQLRNADKESNLGIVQCIFWALLCWVSQFNLIIVIDLVLLVSEFGILQTVVPVSQIVENVFGNEELST